MRKYLIVIVIIIVLVGIWFMFGNNGASDISTNINSDAAPKSGISTTPLPHFSLEDYSGGIVTSSDFVGKPLVVNSWAVWCPFCRKELPDFAAAQKKFGDSVVFVAVDRAESLDVAKRYSDELGVTDNLTLLLDPTDSFYRSIGGFSMPETIFVDADGYIQDHKRGPMELDEIMTRTQRLLK